MKWSHIDGRIFWHHKCVMSILTYDPIQELVTFEKIALFLFCSIEVEQVGIFKNENLIIFYHILHLSKSGKTWMTKIDKWRYKTIANMCLWNFLSWKGNMNSYINVQTSILFFSNLRFRTIFMEQSILRVQIEFLFRNDRCCSSQVKEQWHIPNEWVL